MTLSHLQKQIRDSIASTSLKGVARILKTDKTAVKIIWAGGVLTLLMMSGYYVYDVAKEYTSYSYSSSIWDVPIYHLESSDDVEMIMPFDATFCNINPFKYNYKEHLSQQDKTAIVWFRDFITALMERDDLSDTFKYILRSRATFLQYLGVEKTVNMSYEKDDMIMNCNLLSLDRRTGELATIACDPDIKRTITVENYACYTVSLNKTRYKELYENGSDVYGVDVVLFVNNILDDIEVPFDIDGVLSQGSGAVAFVHEHGTLPIESDLISILPGTLTQIKCTAQIRKRLSVPHGLCFSDEEAKKAGVAIYGLDTQKYRPNRRASLDYCIQEFVRYKCQCFPAAFKRYFEPPNWDEIPFCFSMDYGIENWMNMTSCLQDELNSIFEFCNSIYVPPCMELRISGDVSSSAWPIKGQQLAFYENVIKGQPFEEEFEIYSTISKLVSNGNKTAAKKLLQQSTLIEENFAKISISLSADNVVILEDKPKMTLTDLFASLGGILNLYSGISFVLAIEVIDLLYKIIFDCPVRPRERKITCTPT